MRLVCGLLGIRCQRGTKTQSSVSQRPQTASQLGLVYFISYYLRSSTLRQQATTDSHLSYLAHTDGFTQKNPNFGAISGCDSTGVYDGQHTKQAVFDRLGVSKTQGYAILREKPDTDRTFPIEEEKKSVTPLMLFLKSVYGEWKKYSKKRV
jgi:hypothetical protein